MIYRLKFLVLLLLFHSTLLGQNKFIKRGDKAFLKGNYSEAIIHFKNVKAKSPAINRKIAESYFVMGNYDQAETYYDSIEEADKLYEDLLHLSQMNFEKDNFTAAMLFAERAGEMGADPNKVQIRLSAIRQTIEFRNVNQNSQISKIESQPKSKCLGICLLPEGLVYSQVSIGKIRNKKNYQLYSSSYENETFDSPKLFAGKLEPKTDLGAICVSPDGTTMYYTRWYIRKGKQQMEIAIAKKKKGEWVSKASLGFCGRNYSCCYPFLSADGKTMYFSSDMKGGYGGMDLYVSQQKDGKWTKPKNLGKSINTAKNEIYPRISSNNQLWFSSDGRSGYGELDLFFTSKNEDGSWAAVINPGAPYNSPFSDYSILDFPDANTQLIVSDREDAGMQDQIFKLKKEVTESVQILVRDALSNELLNGAIVTVKKALENKNVALSSQKNGKEESFFRIPKSEFDKGILYEISIKKDGYQDQIIEYYPSNQKREVEVRLDRVAKLNQFSFVSKLTPILYPKKKITFQNIYFEKNEADFSDEAKKVLDRLYRFWREFPELGIKINAHSDSRGSEQMNKNLTLKKAEKAKVYLLDKGIKSSAIEIGAWGEEFILNGCFDESECSEKKHQENRRLELIIVL